MVIACADYHFKSGKIHQIFGGISVIRTNTFVFDNTLITERNIQVRVIFGGSLMIEQVFNIAGIGSLITIAIQGRDYMVIQGCVLIISVFVVIVNLIIDLLYGFVDPRIRKSWR